MTKPATAKRFATEGDGSGYRAAGLCAAKHPIRGVFCTRRAGHSPGHGNPYVGRTSPRDAVGLQW